jgi:hypothetical protein
VTAHHDRAVANRLDGAWVRDGRRIGDGALVEPSSVVWVTVAPYFGDVRVLKEHTADAHALDHTQAFAGTLSVVGDTATWHHELDTVDRGDHHADTATVVERYPHLVEIGDGYEERWTKVESDVTRSGVADLAGPAGALRARIVLIAERAIVVWAMPTPGGALLERRSRWVTAALVGLEPGDLELTTVAASLNGEGRALPRGWRRVA